jgi:iron complex outermembrane recepter protein
MRTVVAAAVISLSVVAIATAEPAAAAMRKPIDIPAGSLGLALQNLARAEDIHVIFVSEDVAGILSPRLTGSLTADEALARLLSGTKLTYKHLGTNTVTVIPTAAVQPPTTSGNAAGSNDGEAGQAKSLGERFRVAQADQGGGVASTPVGGRSSTAQDGSSGIGGLEEIVVTAQKRNERLQDVPVPVTSINTQSLVDSNQLRLQDYYSQIPGLSVTPADTRGAPVLAIRGVTTGGSLNPTVGITVDDIPYGSSVNLGGGFAAPDLDPSDLARIEVLRGPQGTLYGASSIGGLLKYVTVDPTTDGLRGHVQVGTNRISHSNDLGYDASAAVNVPLSTTFAVRVSGFTRQDHGYIDNVLTGERGINTLDSRGGRLSALWRPSDAFSLKLSALFQHAAAEGASEVDLGLGDLNQSRVRGSGGFDRKIQAYSAVLKAKFGTLEVAALSGYSLNRGGDSQDFTSVYGAAVTDPLFQVPGTPTSESYQTRKFTQEVRVSAPLGSQFEGLVGVFYTHETSHNVQDIFAADPFTGIRVGQLVNDDVPSRYEEYAGFADLTWHPTDRFDIQIGGRESQNRQKYRETLTGPLYPLFYPQLTSPVVNPEIDTQDNSFTYLLTPRFKVSADLMVYARLASGYRPGGPNQTSTLFNAPPSYRPDRTNNYEIGVKGNVLDQLLSFDASLYYITWKDIQLTFVDPTTFAGYFVNASRARSQGIELSTQARPAHGLTIAAWVTWNDATLTRALPMGGDGSPVGAPGSRLPNTSRFSGNLSIQQDFPVAGNVTGYIQGVLSYVGDRVGVFTGTPDRQGFAGYAKTDVRAGLKDDEWTLNLYVTNATDRRGVLTGGLGTVNPAAFTYIQPRAIGLSVDRHF